jgi:hypothetical protein
MVRWIMVDEVSKDLEGSSHRLIKVLSQNLSRGADENHKRTSVRIASVPAKIQTGHLPSTRLDHYFYNNLLFLT